MNYVTCTYTSYNLLPIVAGNFLLLLIVVIYCFGEFGGFESCFGKKYFFKTHLQIIHSNQKQLSTTIN